MPRPHLGRRNARLVAALLLSAVAYTAWVLEVVLSTGLDPVRAYIGELAAEDQPLGGLFRATDLVAGLAVLTPAVTVLLTEAARRHGWWPPVRRYGSWLLAGELLVTGWSLAAIAAFEAGHGTWSLGAGRRLQVLLVAIWPAVSAASLTRDGRERAAEEQPAGRAARWTPTEGAEPR
ncbi:DUF998 domain-containing protein [Streptomyces sp. CB01881]|uniref:DUF998 domain-containing protein n=1 Tax=Streptomyces sp. CB01881 TaxID=2078691 RepID=UPI000CDC0AF4|nr:DUF998 domain-containing protein [Streptomyces sp. CB01881]AUY51649.1 hypothetical protein C2142_25005 [Streptomyces sp. CB01881]TYC71081.1 DUF998 domain-containing protein [Streptomyces sp. CB01881]